MFPDGILLGVWICPEGHQHDLAVAGSAFELGHAAKILGLEPSPEVVEWLAQGKAPEDAVIPLTDERGSYATIQPTKRASDIITAAITQGDFGGEPPF